LHGQVGHAFAAHDAFCHGALRLIDRSLARALGRTGGAGGDHSDRACKQYPTAERCAQSCASHDCFSIHHVAPVITHETGRWVRVVQWTSHEWTWILTRRWESGQPDPNQGRELLRAAGEFLLTEACRARPRKL
jgi:hypothetical protein